MDGKHVAHAARDIEQVGIRRDLDADEQRILAPNATLKS